MRLPARPRSGRRLLIAAVGTDPMEIICCRVGVDGNASHILPITAQITSLICVVPAHIVRSIVVAVCVLHRPLRKSVLRQEPVQGYRHIRKLGVIVTVVCTVCSDAFPHTRRRARPLQGPPRHWNLQRTRDRRWTSRRCSRSRRSIP